VLWVLVCVAIVLVSVLVLAIAVLRTWRQSVALTKAVGRASDVLAAAGDGLSAPPARSIPAPAGQPAPATARTPDGERLGSRVEESRSAARSWERS
jgi:hypothetical protein